MRQRILLTLMEAASVPVTVTGPLEPRSSLESCLAKRKSKLLGQTDHFPTYLGRENTESDLSKRNKKERERELVFEKKRQIVSLY